MITVKIEVDPGDGGRSHTTVVQVHQSQMKAVQRAMKLVVATLRDNPEELAGRLIGQSIGRTLAKGLGRLLTPKPKR